MTENYELIDNEARRFMYMNRIRRRSNNPSAEGRWKRKKNNA